MFISTEEKRQIISDIESLKALTSKLLADIKTVKPKAKLTDARKIKQREYARKYYEKKRQEKKNANSIKAE